MMPRRMVRNIIQCPDCLDVIESKHRHDFRYCKCKNTCIDGGLDYQRYGAKNIDKVINLAEYEGEDDPKAIEAMNGL